MKLFNKKNHTDAPLTAEEIQDAAEKARKKKAVKQNVKKGAICVGKLAVAGAVGAGVYMASEWLFGGKGGCGCDKTPDAPNDVDTDYDDAAAMAEAAAIDMTCFV